MNNNNLFQYATKELSQDAMLCWLINWLNYPDSELYPLGKDVLDLFLGENRQEKYFNVQVKRQYKKIDVLVLFNDEYALIIEDKTNTSEHGEQIARYKEMLQQEDLAKTIFTAYIKTGIMYDEDYMMIQKTDTVVTLDEFLPVLLSNSGLSNSAILKDYIQYLSGLSDERWNIDRKIKQCDLNEPFSTFYGQYSFMNQVFSARSKGIELGRTFKEKDKNPIVYADLIYAAANNDGSPWTQYCFWGKAYEKQLLRTDKIEYHYLFWRLDRFWDRKEKMWRYYIALRHYDEHTKKTEETKIRKKDAYLKLREKCDIYQKKYKDVFKEMGTRENYNESDLLYAQVDNLVQEFNDDFSEIADMLDV